MSAEADVAHPNAGEVRFVTSLRQDATCSRVLVLMQLANVLLAIGVGALAGGVVLLVIRGAKPKLLDFSQVSPAGTSTQVRFVANPKVMVGSGGEPGTFMLNWPSELQLRYPGATEMNRVHAVLSRSIKLGSQTQGSELGRVEESITLISDDPPDRILAWYREQLAPQGWQPADGSSGVSAAGSSTQRYLRNEEELRVTIDDSRQVREKVESLRSVIENSEVQKRLAKIVAGDLGVIEALQHLPDLNGKTVFELRYSKKSQG